jgi:hypothetical protein
MSNDQNTNPDPNEPQHIKDLRSRAEQAGQLGTENATLQQEIAMLRVGIDPATTLGRTIRQEHQGEFTPEALAATAARVRQELGLPAEGATPPPPTPEPGSAPDSAEALAQQARDLIASGGQAAPGTEPPPKPFDNRAQDTMRAARAQGMTQQEAEEAGIGEIIRAAANGEQGAVYNEGQWLAEAAKHGHGSEFAALPERKL